MAAWRKSRYGFAFFFSAVADGGFSALRVLLFFQFNPAVHLSRADLPARSCRASNGTLRGAALHAAPALLVPDHSRTLVHHPLASRVAALGLFLFWFVQVFLLMAEYYFFDEFRSRFNTVAVDYLLYPHEVFINIWDSYPVPALISAWLLSPRGSWWRSGCSGRLGSTLSARSGFWHFAALRCGRHAGVHHQPQRAPTSATTAR